MKLTAAQLQAMGYVESHPGLWLKKQSQQELPAKIQAAVDVMAMAAKQVAQPQTTKRIRQSDKPLLNKLEAAWLDVLRVKHPSVTFRAQARRYKLANGAWYKPDISAIIDGQEIAWECKGPRQMKNTDRGTLVLKFAAAQWPEIHFYLVWKKDGQWQEQRVLP